MERIELPAATGALRAFFLPALAVLWWLTAYGQVERYLGSFPALLALPFAIVLLWAAAHLTARLAREPWAERSFEIVLWVLVAALAAAFAWLYPVAQSGALGAGSDRDEALDTALAALLRGDYPYYALTYLGNPISPMPGALFLAAPFHVLGGAALQNIFWIAVLAWSLRRWYGDAVAASAFLSAFVFANPGVMAEFVAGGDYVINAVYVAVAIEAVLVAGRAGSRSAAWLVLAAVFLAVAVSSRIIYVAVLPAVVAYVAQQGGARRAALCAVVLGLTLAAVNLPFVLYDFAGFSPWHTAGKANVLPFGEYYLPFLAVLVSASGFARRLGQARVYLLAGAALAVMIVPVVAVRLATEETGLSGNFVWPVLLFVGVPLYRSALGLRPHPKVEIA